MAAQGRAESDATLVLRAGAAPDMAAITAIYGHAVRHGTGTFELDPPGDAEMAARHAAITGRGYPYLVACRGEMVVGYAYVYAYRERLAYRFTVENSIYVRPGLGGGGIGTALLHGLIAQATAAGFRQMVAVIGDSANTASIRLHRRAGFSDAGTVRAVGWKAGRWLDVVVLQRALGTGDAAPPSDGAGHAI